MVRSPIDSTTHELTVHWDKGAQLIPVEYIAYAVAVVVAALVDVLFLYY
jgi:hypothetical protein